MIGAGATRGEADQRVTFRLGRRDILIRRDPVQLVAIVGEHALRHPPCPTDVMTDQLRQLLKWSDLDNVTLQALPMGRTYTSALEGPFVLIEFERARPVVHLEHYRSSTTITDAGDVKDYQAAADILRRVAMSPAATAELIAKLADETEHAT
jgi:hypothetical protein